jgi:hypothetical protein
VNEIDVLLEIDQRGADDLAFGAMNVFGLFALPQDLIAFGTPPVVASAHQLVHRVVRFGDPFKTVGALLIVLPTLVLERVTFVGFFFFVFFRFLFGKGLFFRDDQLILGGLLVGVHADIIPRLGEFPKEAASWVRKQTTAEENRKGLTGEQHQRRRYQRKIQTSLTTKCDR